MKMYFAALLRLCILHSPDQYPINTLQVQLSFLLTDFVIDVSAFTMGSHVPMAFWFPAVPSLAAV